MKHCPTCLERGTTIELVSYEVLGCPEVDGGYAQEIPVWICGECGYCEDRKPKCMSCDEVDENLI